MAQPYDGLGRILVIIPTFNEIENIDMITGRLRASVPDDIVQACLILSTRLFKRKDSPEGVAGFADFGAVRLSRMDPDVQALLNPFRIIPVG